MHVALEIPAVLQAKAAAMAARPIFGFTSEPMVINYGTYAEIELDQVQQEQLSAWIIRQLDAEPGAVRVNLAGVFLRVLVRKYWPWIAGTAAAGALGGFLVRGIKWK